MFLVGSQLSQVGSGPGLEATGKPLAKTVDEIIITPPQLPAQLLQNCTGPSPRTSLPSGSQNRKN